MTLPYAAWQPHSNHMNCQDKLARSICFALAAGWLITLAATAIGMAWLADRDDDLYEAIDILTEFAPKVK